MGDVEWTDEAREAVYGLLVRDDLADERNISIGATWAREQGRYKSGEALAALAPHVDAMLREARLNIIRALDPCRGDDETDERHFDVCEPFYAEADGLLLTFEHEGVRRGE